MTFMILSKNGGRNNGYRAEVNQKEKRQVKAQNQTQTKTQKMSKPSEHLDKIGGWLDLITAELKLAGQDGHFDEFGANKDAGAVGYELSKLRESVEKKANS